VCLQVSEKSDESGVMKENCRQSFWFLFSFYYFFEAVMSSRFSRHFYNWIFVTNRQILAGG
jgi:hypothetical protein